MTALLLGLTLAAARPPLDLPLPGPSTPADEPAAPAADTSTTASSTDAAALAALGSDPDFDRLLGHPRGAEATAPPAGTGFGLAGLWPLGLAAVGAGLVWLARKRTPGLGGPSEEGPWVIGRSALASGTQAILLEVRDAAGRRRRLLVATGTSAPTLLADLGEDDDAAEPSVPATRPRTRADRTLRGRSLPVLAPVAEPVPRPGPDRTAKHAAMSLIDEVVSTRRGPEVPGAVARDRYTAGSR